MKISSKGYFSVHFWGVRGSIACPGYDTLKYGGNTPCVEIRIKEHRFIFDGGTGLRVLGQFLLKHLPVKAHLFFSHHHWDHIQGFPSFAPAYIPGNHFTIYSSEKINGCSIKKSLMSQMSNPNFPVPIRIMSANLDFHTLKENEILEVGDVMIEHAPLNHPGGATGYRVSWQGHSVAYITDTEHFPNHIDENVLKLAHKADVMIYDSTYSDEEYHSKDSSKVGWGHSTWQEAVKIAEVAGVDKLVIFHHDPDHNDDYFDELGRLISQCFPNSVIAREGMVVSIIP